ncbi:hypothetical protein [Embleya sp. AB8]|uniref:hypothetical protein n=1 Tax=Embleya sp. AB8 TaxID=3156304 RepID=UPI003C78FE14
MDNDLRDPDRPTLTTTIDGRPAKLPGTLADIRAALPEDQREAFDKEINNAALLDIAPLAAHWAIPPDERARIEADAERVRSGDLTGVVDVHGNPVQP